MGLLGAEASRALPLEIGGLSEALVGELEEEIALLAGGALALPLKPSFQLFGRALLADALATLLSNLLALTA